MRTANTATAIQSLSKMQNSAILLITADPSCGNSAFQVLGFLPDGALVTLKFSGSVVVKADTMDEYLELRGMKAAIEDAFESEARLGGEAILLQAGTPVFQLCCEGTLPSDLAA